MDPDLLEIDDQLAILDEIEGMGLFILMHAYL